MQLADLLPVLRVVQPKHRSGEKKKETTYTASTAGGSCFPMGHTVSHSILGPLLQHQGAQKTSRLVHGLYTIPNGRLHGPTLHGPTALIMSMTPTTSPSMTPTTSPFTRNAPYYPVTLWQMVAYADQAPLCNAAPLLTAAAAAPGSSCDQGVPSETTLLATTLWPKTYSVQKCFRFVLMQRSADSALYLPSLEGSWRGDSECQVHATNRTGQNTTVEAPKVECHACRAYA